MEKTKITPRTHPELYEPGIIITNAPYRIAFYRVEKIGNKAWDREGGSWSANNKCYWVNILSKHGIEIEKVS